MIYIFIFRKIRKLIENLLITYRISLNFYNFLVYALIPFSISVYLLYIGPLKNFYFKNYFLKHDFIIIFII